MAGVGLELLFNSVRNQINNPNDTIVCYIHCELINNKYKCIGIGERIPEGDVSPSELLPDGWNNSSDVYSIMYRTPTNEKTVLLKIVKVDSALLVHLMRLEDEVSSQISFETDHFTTGSTTFNSAYKHLDELKRLIVSDLLGPLHSATPGVIQQQGQTGRRNEQSSQRNPDDPLRVGPPRHPANNRVPPDWAEPGDPFSIGRSDLDPLASGASGGGMIFDPMRSGGYGRGGFINPNAGMPGQLPRGAVPPGARFDPFGPPDLDRSGNPRRGGSRTGPDPDHLPPPGYDDMFM